MGDSGVMFEGMWCCWQGWGEGWCDVWGMKCC